jgi:AraC-like DNA-binding protein
MDVHYIPGLAAYDAAEAHQKDLAIQQQHHCKCMTYWIDEPRGVVFCLIEAPDKHTVEEMHKRSHGLIPNKILEVNNSTVESFLGRIHDPDDAPVAENGLKIFSDPAYRVLLLSRQMDYVLLQHKLGPQKAEKLLTEQDEALRQGSAMHGGRMTGHFDDASVISFSSVAAAVACASDIRQRLSGPDHRVAEMAMSITSGNPVSSSDQLFGEALQLGMRLCQLKSSDRIVLSVAVKDLLPRDFCRERGDSFCILSSKDETLMESLWGILEKHGQEPEFGVEPFCRMATLSKSQLYRKTLELWDLAPNPLLRHFRLNKALRLLRKQACSIAGITFETGFTSPSYFTKCFRETFGLSPAAYMQMV